MSDTGEEYLLGASDAELDRLGFQHRVWRPITEAFLDRLGIGVGARVLDLGCGPGFLIDDLLERVGPEGQVHGIDASPRWQEVLAQRFPQEPRLLVERKRVEDLPADGEGYDLIVCRWLFCFLADPGGMVATLAKRLRPGGVLAVQDYNHEGISLFPHSPGFRALIQAIRAWFQASGGDPWIAPQLPAAMRAAGLEMEPLGSTVLSGSPDTDIFRWGDLFFTHFADELAASGFLSAEDHRTFEAEWPARRANPDTVFSSPILMDVAGRRPS